MRKQFRFVKLACASRKKATKTNVFFCLFILHYSTTPGILTFLKKGPFKKENILVLMVS